MQAKWFGKESPFSNRFCSRREDILHLMYLENCSPFDVIMPRKLALVFFGKSSDTSSSKLGRKTQSKYESSELM